MHLISTAVNLRHIFLSRSKTIGDEQSDTSNQQRQRHFARDLKYVTKLEYVAMNVSERVNLSEITRRGKIYCMSCRLPACSPTGRVGNVGYDVTSRQRYFMNNETRMSAIIRHFLSLITYTMSGH
jgi:hypothetical protein